jgi:hypothetical protein
VPGQFHPPTDFSRPGSSPYPQPPRKKRWPWIAGSAVALVAVVTALGAAGSTEEEKSTNAAATSSAPATTTVLAPPPSATPAPAAKPVVQVSTAPAANAALTTLNSLAVKGRAPKTGYDRVLFGQTWTDNVTVDGGRNGCDTRNDILRRDLVNIVVKPGSKGCAVESGTLNDPYTAATIQFVRGQDTSTAVQIDHVVALSNAWQTGAQQLTPEKRADFANDPRNLQATDGPTNQQKSDGDAATWLPSNKSYRCTYVTRQVEVKAAYALWVTQPEKDAITRVLADCGATVAAVSTPAVAETRTQTPIPAPRTTTTTFVPAAPAYTPPRAYTPPPEPAYTPPPVVYAPNVSYKNCSAVRAAGADPIYRGDPGYAPHLDRDGDGVGCE